MAANVSVDIIPQAVTVTLTMDAEQALRVMGVLGKSTGISSVGEVYDALWIALEANDIYTVDDFVRASAEAHVLP